MRDSMPKLTTEVARADFADLDLRPTRELVRLINDEDATVAVAVRRACEEVAHAVDEIAARMTRGGRLVYVGAGSAGRIAALDAAEIGPTFGMEQGRVTAIVAGGLATLTDPREGVEDDEVAGVADVRALEIAAQDSVVGVSASGRTPYVLAALSSAASRGALVVGVSCNAGSPLSDLARIAIEVVVGPEVIAGSTRLKAGTAQKLVCNMLSTATMVKLGRTYGNWMVDVRTDNEKLRGRARRILVEAAGVGEDEAARLLAAAGGETKVALVAALSGLDVPTARDRLTAAGGRVRTALQAVRAGNPEA